MAIPFNRYAYTIDKDTEEIHIPDVFLVDNQLNKIGILYPVSDLVELYNMNDADEVSFSIYQNVNGNVNPHYDRLDTGSIVQVGKKYYEVKITENDKLEGGVKSASGTELAYVELSNRLVTLEVNTENDIVKREYVDEDTDMEFPTVFCRDIHKYDVYNWKSGITASSKMQVLSDSSLLHRILSFVPNYEIGHVDDTLRFVNRQFSWSNQDALSVLHDVAQEAGCIFTFTIERDEDGNVKRLVNAFDLCYCKTCYEKVCKNMAHAKTFRTSLFRSVTNGVCDHQKEDPDNPVHSVYDIGSDSGILITTENLSEDMTLEPKDDIVNCIKIEAGDEVMTNIVEGQLMGGNHLMMFSEEQKADMSSDLRNSLEKYYTDYDKNLPHYKELRETQYNIEDLIQYLQSGKMPTIEQNSRTLEEEVTHILNSIKKDYDCQFYVSSYDKFIKEGHYSISMSTVRNMVQLYLDEGYSVKIINGDLDNPSQDSQNRFIWNGTIRIYETTEMDSVYADIQCTASSTYVTYSTRLDSNGSLYVDKTTFSDFRVKFIFAYDTESIVKYKKYIEQYCDQLLALNEVNAYKNEEEKDWTLYSYERLHSFFDGYQTCIDALEELRPKAYDPKNTVDTIVASYRSIQKDVENQMIILVDQIRALYRYSGREAEKEIFNADPEYMSMNEALYSLISTRKYPDGRSLIGKVPYNCNHCGSANVGTSKYNNYCKSCQSTDVTTYHDIAAQVYNFWKKNSYSDTTRITKTVDGEYLPRFGITRYYLNPGYNYQVTAKKNTRVIFTDDKDEITPVIHYTNPSNSEYQLDLDKKYFIDNTRNASYIIEAKIDQDIYYTPVSSFWELPKVIYDKYHNGLFTYHAQNINRVQQSKFNGITIWQTTDLSYKLVSKNIPGGDVDPSTLQEWRGKYIWCYGVQDRDISIKYEIQKDSFLSVADEIQSIMKTFDLCSYLGPALYYELNTFIREDVYSNSNYTSENLNNNKMLLDSANELIAKAQDSLASSCVQQYTISSSIGAIVAQKWKIGANSITDYYRDFKLGNWIRARLNNHKDFYKLRVTQIEIPYSDDIKDIKVQFSDVIKNIYKGSTDVESILSQSNTVNHTFDYYASQAEQGSDANASFNKLKQEGLDAALSAVKAGDNQSVLIDNHGILLRHFDRELDDYDNYQMKLINRNLVMTSDNWKTASLAIGLGKYKDTLKYGVWAELLCGDLIVGSNLLISNTKSTVEIDGEGIKITGGSVSIHGKNDKTYAEISEDGVLTCRGAKIVGYSTSDDLLKAKEDIKNDYTSLLTAVNSNINEIENNMNFISSEALEDKTTGLTTRVTKVKNWSGETISQWEETSRKDSDYIIVNRTVGSKDSTYHKTTSFAVSKDGLLEADNAIIYGTVYASAGEIGGWSINDTSIYNLKPSLGPIGDDIKNDTVTGIYNGIDGYANVYEDSFWGIRIAKIYNGTIEVATPEYGTYTSIGNQGVYIKSIGGSTAELAGNHLRLTPQEGWGNPFYMSLQESIISFGYSRENKHMLLSFGLNKINHIPWIECGLSSTTKITNKSVRLSFTQLDIGGYFSPLKINSDKSYINVNATGLIFVKVDVNVAVSEPCNMFFQIRQCTKDTLMESYKVSAMGYHPGSQRLCSGSAFMRIADIDTLPYLVIDIETTRDGAIDHISSRNTKVFICYMSIDSNALATS